MTDQNESLKGTDHISDERIKEIEKVLQTIDSGEESHLTDAVKVTEPEPKPVAESTEIKVDEPQVSTEAAAESTDDAPTLPDNYTRSLLASGWSAEEITEQHAALGDEFVTIAEKVHERRKIDAREWAAHGRIEANQRAAADDASRQETPDTPSEIERLDIAALKKEYGDDPRIASLIDKLGTQTNRAIEAMNSMLPNVAESAARQDASEKAALQNEINSFFGSPDVLSYKDFYGVGPTQSVNGDHYDSRMRVLEVADQIRVGASYQGREVGLTEALSLAHDSVSADYRVRAIREDIKSKLQERAGSVTTPPSKGSESGNTSAPKVRTEKTRDEIEQHATDALRQIFG
jgi:hypothetical protein